MDKVMKLALMEMITKLDQIKPFTVGDMKKAIEGLSDDTQIIIGGDEFDWANLSLEYKQPNEEEGYLGLTFFLKDNFDPRQF
jgi:hypothetical protein